MSQSLDQYLTLSKEEQSPPLTAFQKLSILTKALIHGPLPLSELEEKLIKDESFINPIVQSSQFIKIDQFDINYLYIPAKDQKETILFIHGLGGSFKQFDEVISQLIPLGYGILAFDQPGSGDSLVNNDVKLTLKFFTDYTYKLIEGLKLTESPLIILSHSYGTQITINLLINYDLAKITKIWLLTPPLTPKPSNLKENLLIGGLYYNPWIFEAFRKFDRLNNIKSPSLNRLTESKDDYLRFKQLRLNLKTHSKNFLNQLYNWQTLTFEDLDKFKRVIESKGIQLVIVDGEFDKLTKQSGEVLHKYLKVGQYKLFEKGGHNFLLDLSTEFIQLFQSH
ncbi:hypothetical protein WICMUC_000181 [Wickerhamomyces mucosus]|uniref:AB hydrolase-1 domain-containing protein n=1 Tax=Wickerhamomyces mucosus TaxID=1378264 RepID=A0A9P8PYA0_9ASCO|nr:hypothetical protein WICMUC_000181 [Wickerhamomyces mucosus]